MGRLRVSDHPGRQGVDLITRHLVWTMTTDLNDSALLIIDVQRGLDDPALGRNRNNPQAEANMARLLAEWRRRERPVIHVRHSSVDPHSPLRPGLPGHAFKEEVRPLEREEQFDKTVNSAFVGTGLADHLRSREISSLVVVGLTTDHCVSATTRNAADLGFDVTLVADATATFERQDHEGAIHPAEAVHKVNLASLKGEFCRVRCTEELLS